jgi:sterol 3beta-glucosyltransferase
MRITMVATGSRGDVQPHIALGERLQAHGHTVRLATHASFAALVRDRGLEISPIAGDPRAALESCAGLEVVEEDRSLIRYVNKFSNLIAPYISQAVADCLHACEDADVIIVSQLGIVFAYHVAEKLKLPLVRAFSYPVSPTRAYPVGFIPTGLHLGSRFNLWSHYLSRQLLWLMVRRSMNRVRDEVLNLGPLPLRDPFARMDREHRLLLYSYSPSIFPRMADWGDWIHVTGHWFLDRAPSWQPPRDLVDFLESGPPPVYVGFGSMISRSAEETTELVLKALARARQRGVLLTGWGGLQRHPACDDVYVVDDTPHDWLFPRMAAVVHHGGAGTTHAGLRAGTPGVVIPFMPDQQFWGRRLHEIGSGARPIPRRELSAMSLAEAIQTVTQDKMMQSRARALGERIRDEDGLAHAVAAFHRHPDTGLNRAGP